MYVAILLVWTWSIQKLTIKLIDRTYVYVLYYLISSHLILEEQWILPKYFPICFSAYALSAKTLVKIALFSAGFTLANGNIANV